MVIARPETNGAAPACGPERQRRMAKARLSWVPARRGNPGEESPADAIAVQAVEAKPVSGQITPGEARGSPRQTTTASKAMAAIGLRLQDRAERRRRIGKPVVNKGLVGNPRTSVATTRRRPRIFCRPVIADSLASDGEACVAHAASPGRSRQNLCAADQGQRGLQRLLVPQRERDLRGRGCHALAWCG